MNDTILIVSPCSETRDVLIHRLSAEGKPATFEKFALACELIYEEIPKLVIVDLFADPETSALLNNLKEDPLFSGLPVLAILDDPAQLPDWDTLQVDDYIWRKDIAEEILMRTGLCILRARRVVEINPLTRLPGNISINRQIQERLNRGERFALAYTDLDYFKPYNDKYGFGRGDDVIRITGRILLNATKNRQPRNSFVGHIGGDDFVCITGEDVMEELCEDVIGAFDRIIPSFYDPEDRNAGHVRGRDRGGNERTFPFLSISIGVIVSESGSFSHYGEITEVAAEVKAFAKTFEGSCYRFNRRDYTKRSP